MSFIPGHNVPIVVPFIRADLTAGGTLLAVSLASASAPGASGGSGQLSADVRPHLSSTAALEAAGSALARVEAGAAAVLVVSADFDSAGTTQATDAHTRGMGELSATVVTRAGATASFHGSSSALGVIYAPPVPMTAAMTGVGDLTALAEPGFSPSSMDKTGTQSGPSTTNAWIQVVNWTADAGGYPGSTVDTHALISQGGNETATVSSSISWASGTWSTSSISVRIKLNGTVIATGTTANPAIAAATVAIAQGDRVTVEVKDGNAFAQSSRATINAAGTYVRIT
ncbi:hypothetical protein [Nocardia shimofusensis]|uniref:hypothetical protein n=1 Tax=Nocardia shimofusensis TaxID=228596 RepID=UPI000830E885|nr:hypothetical protein [Nocardia shimofusensis]